MPTTKTFQLMMISMMLGLSQLLGLTANAAPTMYPRQVDLSGNIFQCQKTLARICQQQTW